MDFINKIDNLNSNEIIKILEHNIKTAAFMRSEISNLTNYPTNNIVIEEEKKVIKKDELEENNEDYEYEDEIEYYLEDYKSIKNISIESLLEILPSKSIYNYKEIIIRLQAESIKEIKELEELLILEDDIETLKEIKNTIINEQLKIKLLKEILNKEEVLEEEKDKNKIILAPTLSGNIRIIDDLEHIPQEYYQAFLELINSIIDGTFKGAKRLINDLATGTTIREVRGDGIRVLFHRVDKNTYSLITAFLKKTYANKGYKEFIKSRISSYQQVEDYIKESLNDEEFIKENELYVDELFNLLDKENTTNSVLGG